MSDKTQIRGICQCCGRDQAVVRGSMSKHGYTVAGGWFQGVCTGQNYVPLEISRDRLDAIVAQVRADVAALRVEAAEYASGKRVPTELRTSHRRGAPLTPWAECAVWQQVEGIKSIVFNKEQRARAGDDFCKDMLGRADLFHGKELRVVKVDGGPDPIPEGERRVTEAGRTLRATLVKGGRVYWTTECDRKFKGWTGSAAWRRLAPATI